MIPLFTYYCLIFAEVRLGTRRTRTEVWETRASGSNPQSLCLNCFTGHICQLLLNDLPARRFAGAVNATAVCVSVCHKSEFFQNGCTDRLGVSWRKGHPPPPAYPSLYWTEIQVLPKMRGCFHLELSPKL